MKVHWKCERGRSWRRLAPCEIAAYRRSIEGLGGPHSRENLKALAMVLGFAAPFLGGVGR